MYLKNQKNSFYLVLFFSVIAIFFTNPFLIYPYDVYTHLQWIDEQYNNQSIVTGRETWHYVWSNIFHLLHIDRTDIFLRARFIHFTQILFSFFIIFYFSKVMIRNLFNNIRSLELNYVAYWATLIWFTVYSTYSVHHHQVWILWYSVNYQISLLFTLLITALFLSILLEPLSIKRKIIYVLLIFVFSVIILRIHAMEYIYYLMYMSVLAIIFIDKIIIVWKRNLLYSIPITLILILLLIKFINYINTFAYRKSPIFKFFSFEKLPDLFTKIQSKGQLLLAHYNKASTTINELIYLSFILFTIMFVIILYRRYNGYPVYINIRLSIFLFITSLFIIIPLTKITGGIASTITYTTVAYRFYFSSLLFLILPSVVFYLYSINNIKKIYIINITIFTLLLGTTVYSKHFSETHNYYKNIISIKNSFNAEKMRFNLSDKEIKIIGDKLSGYESLNLTQKKNYYYARDDIAFVIKFIYRKPVQYYRRGSKNYRRNYSEHSNKKFYPVLFEVPKNFPSYQRFK